MSKKDILSEKERADTINSIAPAYRKKLPEGSIHLITIGEGKLDLFIALMETVKEWAAEHYPGKKVMMMSTPEGYKFFIEQDKKK